MENFLHRGKPSSSQASTKDWLIRSHRMLVKLDLALRRQTLSSNFGTTLIFDSACGFKVFGEYASGKTTVVGLVVQAESFCDLSHTSKTREGSSAGLSSEHIQRGCNEVSVAKFSAPIFLQICKRSKLVARPFCTAKHKPKLSNKCNLCFP